MGNIIAKVQLVKGHLGYYDELSGIYLTHANPVAEIKAGTNCSILRASAKAGRIRVIEGTLTQKVDIGAIFGNKKKVDKKAVNPTVVNTAVMNTAVQDEKIIETIPEPEPKVEEEATAQEVEAEVQEEKPQTKKKARRKSNKSKEAPVEE